MRWVVLLIASLSTTAVAEPRVDVVYVEALGKHGLYGFGYERQLRPWLSIGSSASVYTASGRTGFAAAAYLGVGTALSGRHRWFAQLGPQLVSEREPAVLGFDGVTATSIGGVVTGGYEYRAERWLVRGHAVLSIGRGGAAPWMGASFGVRL